MATDYNSKYSGEEVEQLLDQVANGEVGGGETLTEAEIANMGFTKNQGTITEVKMNGVSKGTSGVVDLGDVPSKNVVDTLVDWHEGADADIAALYEDKQDNIADLDAIRDGAAKGATAVQSDDLMWVKAEGEAGVRLKGTNGTATGNYAISAGDDKTASDGTAYPSVASGDHAVAFGYGNTCAGRSTLAQGLYNIVNGKDAVAFGQRNTVNGDQAFAAGQLNEVTTRLGVTLGYKNKATNTNSIAIGYQNTSSGSGSVALGDSCESNGTSSTAMGYKTKATGAYSSTFGENTQATNNGEVAMGVYNKSTTSTDASQQTLFSFGIGTSDTNRLNALEIKKNGDVYIGDRLLPEGDFVTTEDLSGVATSGSYNDLSDKPTIPSEVTESTVSGWGFTKNAGTYSKPSGGIPRSDLDNEVITALRKAEQYTGTLTDVKMNGSALGANAGVVDIGNVVTSVKVNNETKSPSGGVVDLGSVGTYSKPSGGIPKSDLASDVQTLLDKANVAVTKDNIGGLDTIQTQGFNGSLNDMLYALPDEANGNEDDILLSRNSVKTINGQSIFGSGNITIEGGSSGGGKEVVLNSTGVIELLEKNKIYIVTSNNRTFEIQAIEEVLEPGEYAEYVVVLASEDDMETGNPLSITLPDNVYWANGQIPDLTLNANYELSIVGWATPNNIGYNAVLTPFQPA